MSYVIAIAVAAMAADGGWWRSASHRLIPPSLVLGLRASWDLCVTYDLTYPWWDQQLLGGTFEGRVILLSSRLYQLTWLTFADKTIVSHAHLSGWVSVDCVISLSCLQNRTRLSLFWLQILCHLHWLVSLGPTQVSGVVYNGGYIINAIVTEDGVGPCRIIVAHHDSKCTENLSVQWTDWF